MNMKDSPFLSLDQFNFKEQQFKLMEEGKPTNQYHLFEYHNDPDSEYMPSYQKFLIDKMQFRAGYSVFSKARSTESDDRSSSYGFFLEGTLDVNGSKAHYSVYQHFDLYNQVENCYNDHVTYLLKILGYEENVQV